MSRFPKLRANVNGIMRNIYVESSERARLYVGSRVVSGSLSQGKKGELIFTPSGKNASLV